MVCDLLAGGDLRYHLQQQVTRLSGTFKLFANSFEIKILRLVVWFMFGKLLLIVASSSPHPPPFSHLSPHDVQGLTFYGGLICYFYR